MSSGAIKPIDGASVLRITSGQVIIDLPTAVKELVENSLDAGATSIEVRFKEYGVKSIEVIDNGTGISTEDYDNIALKHRTSKLSTFEDLTTIQTFGFRGEALSSLCALSNEVSVTTATATEAPMGTVLKFSRAGNLTSRDSKVARQRGTTVTVSDLFAPLPVRRKEFTRNSKREYGKALNLLNAYALVPCTHENKGVRLVVSNQPEKGAKNVQLRTDGTCSIRSSASTLWGPKSLENLVDLDMSFEVEPEEVMLRRFSDITTTSATPMRVNGLVSKFTLGCGRTGTDRQYFYINGRPCNMNKAQKVFNEVYRSFNVTQSPVLIVNFIMPTNNYDVNVSPDKRTIFLFSENNFLQALKAHLEETFSSSRSTYAVDTESQRQPSIVPSRLSKAASTPARSSSAPDVPPSADSKPKPVLNATGIDDDMGSPSNDVAPASTLRSHGANEDAQDSPPIVTIIHESTASSNEPLFLSEEEADAPNSPLPLERTSSAPNGDSGSLSIATHAPLSKSPETPIPSLPIPRASGKNRPAEVVLSTTKASWNLRRAFEEHNSDDSNADRVVKKLRLTTASEQQHKGMGKAPKKAESSFEARFSRFARPGSQIPVASTSDAVEEEDELDGIDEDDNENQQASKNTPTTAQMDVDSLSNADSHDSGSRVKPVFKRGEPLRSTKKANRTASHQNREEVKEQAMDIDDAGDMAPRKLSDQPIAKSSPMRTIDLTQEGVGQAIDAIDSNEGDSNGRDPIIEDESSALSSDPSSAVSKEIVRTRTDVTDVTLAFDLSAIKKRWSGLQALGHEAKEGGHDNSAADANVSHDAIRDAGVEIEDENKATDALSRVIDKSDFETMQVVGQFNLGFIIARRIKEGDVGQGDVMDDLFIVDQHAADEKYNFETLQQTTKIDSQKLFQPRPLEVTAADELVAIENMDVLRQNGFELEFTEDAAHHRLKLVAQPVSKNTVFDMTDLEELLHLMHDRPVGQMVRCSKARSMFASRACRKSVMIGMPLTRGQMKTVVQHMGTMEQPWNCPHGRPTMRHLSDLGGFVKEKSGKRKKEGVRWANFLA